MSVAIVERATNRTENLPLVVYLTETQGYRLVAITGPNGRRTFELDKPIEPALVRQFHCSAEKRLLDAHRNLKLAACV